MGKNEEQSEAIIVLCFVGIFVFLLGFFFAKDYYAMAQYHILKVELYLNYKLYYLFYKAPIILYIITVSGFAFLGYSLYNLIRKNKKSIIVPLLVGLTILFLTAQSSYVSMFKSKESLNQMATRYKVYHSYFTDPRNFKKVGFDMFKWKYYNQKNDDRKVEVLSDVYKGMYKYNAAFVLFILIILFKRLHVIYSKRIENWKHNRLRVRTYFDLPEVPNRKDNAGVFNRMDYVTPQIFTKSLKANDEDKDTYYETSLRVSMLAYYKDFSEIGESELKKMESFIYTLENQRTFMIDSFEKAYFENSKNINSKFFDSIKEYVKDTLYDPKRIEATQRVDFISNLIEDIVSQNESFNMDSAIKYFITENLGIDASEFSIIETKRAYQYMLLNEICFVYEWQKFKNFVSFNYINPKFKKEVLDQLDSYDKKAEFGNLNMHAIFYNMFYDLDLDVEGKETNYSNYKSKMDELNSYSVDDGLDDIVNNKKESIKKEYFNLIKKSIYNIDPILKDYIIYIYFKDVKEQHNMKNKLPDLIDPYSFRSKFVSSKEQKQILLDRFKKYAYPDRTDINSPFDMILMPRYYILTPLKFIEEEDKVTGKINKIVDLKDLVENPVPGTKEYAKIVTSYIWTDYENNINNKIKALEDDNKKLSKKDPSDEMITINEKLIEEYKISLSAEKEGARNAVLKEMSRTYRFKETFLIECLHYVRKLLNFPTGSFGYYIKQKNPAFWYALNSIGRTHTYTVAMPIILMHKFEKENSGSETVDYSDLVKPRFKFPTQKTSNPVVDRRLDDTDMSDYIEPKDANQYNPNSDKIPENNPEPEPEPEPEPQEPETPEPDIGGGNKVPDKIPNFKQTYDDDKDENKENKK